MTENNALTASPKTSARSFDQDKPLPRTPSVQGRSQNWFARVFQFKPATRVFALNESKIKSRKEVYKILRKWKKLGVEDVSMDKANSIIRGRVGEVNGKSPYFPSHRINTNKSFFCFICLHATHAVLRLRPVEFSAEFYTVLEHRRQANISLVRFRQERGAASSFNKVVDTLYNVMKQRGMLVEDPSRARKMISILDAFPDQ